MANKKLEKIVNGLTAQELSELLLLATDTLSNMTRVYTYSVTLTTKSSIDDDASDPEMMVDHVFTAVDEYMNKVWARNQVTVESVSLVSSS